MKNATILMTLNDMFAIMDARANVTIFKQSESGESLLRATKIYNLLSDTHFMGEYGKYKVIGLSYCLGDTSILIEEA